MEKALFPLRNQYKRLEARGVPSEQAEAITSAITEVLNDSLENVAHSFVSRAEMQKSEMIQEGNLSKFKSEVQSSQVQNCHEAVLVVLSVFSLSCARGREGEAKGENGNKAEGNGDAPLLQEKEALITLEFEEFNIIERIWALLEGDAANSHSLAEGLSETTALPTKVEVRSAYTLPSPDPTSLGMKRITLNSEHHFSLQQRETEKLRNDIEKMRSELRYEVDKLTAGQRLDLNLERERIRDELTNQNAETTNLTNKLDREIHALRAQIEASKYEVIKYCISAVGLAVLRLYSEDICC
ncbi:hypothetical protein RND71_003628 [Anisodus tanguticus]|uniref:Uncharacterized protein n=1 Tax=Anisodus tanguticus TaxID=243964 RepID=A0AAE1VQ57_9SOLA|nr:hypothetical protein RND71_003628 [Anisodus tanguticus]